MNGSKKSAPSAWDRLLDATVALSFDRSGFIRHSRRFVPGDLEVDLSGQVVVVTGANSGIGRATALGLASRGAEVHMLCRNRERGEAAREELTQQTGGALRLFVVDVADPESVAAYCADHGVARIDALIHNAGALVDERQLTDDGLELTLATHLVGPLRLTLGLLPRMTKPSPNSPARIVWVSSGGMYPRRLSVDRLTRATGPFDGVTAYADVKRAQVVLSELLAERLDSTRVTSNAMHPGWAGTPGVVRALPRFERLTRQRLRTAEQGADTVIWLAASCSVAGDSGCFWFDRRAVPTHALPWTREAQEERSRLWDHAMNWAACDVPEELA